MNADAEKISQALIALSDGERAKGASRFFKSGKGEYGEGDQFIGIANPVIHQQVKRFKPIDIATCEALLQSPFHEIRFFALCMMVALYQPKKSALKETVIKTYLANTRFINNWDLVDCSAYKLLGDYLLDKDRAILFQLAQSKSLWERRIAIVSNFAFIRANDFDTTLALANQLKDDEQDLIHKAVGWMLKEVGKRDEALLIQYIENTPNLPRTLLRTAIEKLPQPFRNQLLSQN